jgi:hypothetical protein
VDPVLADETTRRKHSTTKMPYLWTFAVGNRVLYRFAADRSSKTPEAVLGIPRASGATALRIANSALA